MPNSSSRDLLSKTLLLATLIIPIFILPFSAIDPINTPQLTSLVVAASICLGIIITSTNSIRWPRYKIVLLVLTAFLLDLLLVAVLSRANFGLEFYGTFGRNTGLLTYFSLSILMFTAIILSSDLFLQKYVFVLITTGVIATLYGLIQHFGFDPVPWDNIFSPVIGFLGNPNFQSALLGITGVCVFGSLITAAKSSLKFFLGSLFFLMLVFTIYQTNSKQGLLNLASGICVLLWIFVKEKGKKHFTRLVGVSMCLIGFIVAFGVFNDGPLADVLFKRSISARIFYWEAGWKMTTENPIFGVGLDNYGDWYRRARTIEATIEFGPDSVSDVAHNVLLDFSSNGGFPLLVIYLVIIIITLISIIKVIQRQSQFNQNHAMLVGAWVSYQVQSLVSINQLSLVFIGWVLGGVLIGYEISTRESDEKLTAIKSKKSKNQIQTEPKYVLVVFLSAILGFLVGAQPMISSVKFRSALESGQIDKIKASARLFPLEPLRIYQVASILRDNKYEQDAAEVLEVGLQKFPENYLLWRMLSELPEIPTSQLAQVKEKLRILDPNNEL